MTEHDDVGLIREVLSRRRRDAFSPGFSDRATARWRRELEAGRLARVERTLSSAMSRYFTRLAPLAAAAALVLAFHNVRHRPAGQSALGALFGSEAVSADAAHPEETVSVMHSLDELYDLRLPGIGRRE